MYRKITLILHKGPIPFSMEMANKNDLVIYFYELS